MSLPADVISFLEEGGTILGTDNTCDPFHDPEGGMAGGADVILLPETGFAVDAVARICTAREAPGEPVRICISEGAHAKGQPLS